MLTHKQVTIVSNTRELEFGYWVQEGDDGEFIPLRTEEDYPKAAEYLGCSRELLDMLAMMHDTMLDAIAADLVDIWKRLDKMDQD